MSQINPRSIDPLRDRHITDLRVAHAARSSAERIALLVVAANVVALAALILLTL